MKRFASFVMERSTNTAALGGGRVILCLLPSAALGGGRVILCLLSSAALGVTVLIHDEIAEIGKSKSGVYPIVLGVLHQKPCSCKSWMKVKSSCKNRIYSYPLF